MPLDHFLIHHAPALPTARRKLTASLAEYVAKLHAAGVTHPDLHPGNLLIRANEVGFQFFLIDVHDVVLGRPLGPVARTRNLVLFNRWFQLRTTRADRLRFWRAYAGEQAHSEDARRIERATDRSVVGLWASRDGRCLRKNRHFRVVRGPVVSGVIVRDLGPDAIDGFLADPDAPFAAPDAVLLKSSRSATVCVVSVPTATGPRPMVYKRFRVTHGSDYLAAIFRPPPALRSWKNGHALIDRGLPTPRPWIVIHRKRFGLSGTGYLLCDLVPDARHLHDAIRAASISEKRRLTEVLARWIRLMHERGVSHRDLKAANILITLAGDCQFIDLVGARTQRRVSREVRVRDLSRVNASFMDSLVVTWMDRLRFLRTYLLWGLKGHSDWGVWWGQVRGATAAKVRQNERRNRSLA